MKNINGMFKTMDKRKRFKKDVYMVSKGIMLGLEEHKQKMDKYIYTARVSSKEARVFAIKREVRSKGYRFSI